MCKRTGERRPDTLAQATPGVALVLVRVIVDMIESFLTYVRFDPLPRLIEPGPRPGDALPLNLARDAGETGHAAASQCLQEKSLGLVPPMVGEKDERRMVLD